MPSGSSCSTATPVPWYRPKQDAFSQRPPGNCWDSTPTRNGRYRIGHRSPADWCGSMRRSILVSGISPRLPELAARHPKLQFDLTLTDDFIDPHRDATDILFRISSLPDAGYHARVFGSQRYYLTASRSMFHGTAARLRRRHCINIARWCMAVRREPTAGCFASAKRHGCTIR